jgi:succinate dehydrogenase/fumarate reductase flavoprotein subunit
MPPEMEADMLDVIFIGAGLAFLASAIGYTLICERL